MPQASAYINKVRADAEGRNTKKEYPGAILNQNYLSPLMCTNFKQNGVFSPPWWVPTNYTIPCKCAPSIIAPIKPLPITSITYTYNTFYNASIDTNGYCSMVTTYYPIDSILLNINDNYGSNQSTFITSLNGSNILIKRNTTNIIELQVTSVILLGNITYLLYTTRISGSYDNTSSLSTSDVITIYKE